jgi:hypothetical protein
MKNAFFYFIVFPFYGLIQAVRNYRLPWAKNMVWLFVVFHGYTMYRPELTDSTRYVQKLIDISNSKRTWDNFLLSFYSIDNEGKATVDIYEPLMTNFVSLFTQNGSILFAFFGIVYGYFYSRNIWLIVEEIKKNQSPRFFWVLIFVFASVIGFWELNGVRMWTAAHVFFFGVFQVLLKNNKKGLICIFASILIHFSFGLPILVFLVFYIFRLSFRLSYLIFISSFLINSLDIKFIGGILENVLPELLLPRLESYSNDEYVETVEILNQSANWYIQYFSKVLNFTIAVVITVIYFIKERKYRNDKTFINFTILSLLLLTIGNLMSSLPSGVRYSILAQLFGVAVIILYYIKYNSKYYQKAILYSIPFFLFFLVVSIRISFNTISIMALCSNPLLASIIGTNFPLIDLIK